jgi:8-oxo-dGTP diphosphatase
VSRLNAYRGRMAWLDPEAYWAQVATFHGAAGGLITDSDARVLLVKPDYKDCWSFPGGAMDAGENPAAAAAREVREETGLTVALGGLLVVDLQPAQGPRRNAILHFLFDGGTVPAGTVITPQAEELDDARFVDLAFAERHLFRGGFDRLREALHARATRVTWLAWDHPSGAPGVRRTAAGPG